MVWRLCGGWKREGERDRERERERNWYVRLNVVSQFRHGDYIPLALSVRLLFREWFSVQKDSTTSAPVYYSSFLLIHFLFDTQWVSHDTPPFSIWGYREGKEGRKKERERERNYRKGLVRSLILLPPSGNARVGVTNLTRFIASSHTSSLIPLYLLNANRHSVFFYLCRREIVREGSANNRGGAKPRTTHVENI